MSENQQNASNFDKNDAQQGAFNAQGNSSLLDDMPKAAHNHTPYMNAPNNAPYMNTSNNAPYMNTSNNAPYMNAPNNAPYMNTPNNAPYMNAPNNAPYMNIPNHTPYMNTPNNVPYVPYMNVPNMNPQKPEKQKIKGENYGEAEHYDNVINADMKHSIAYLCVIFIIFAAFIVGIFSLGYFGIIKNDGSISQATLVERPSDGEKYTVEEIGMYVRPAIVDVSCYMKDTSGEMVPYASGSGVIISADGYIVTNQHVISSAEKITVNVYDDSSSDEYRTYTAKVVGYDAKTDLAIIKIQTEATLTVAVLGDAQSCVLGEQVVAIGNPSGYSGSLTTGVISGLNRSIRTDYTGYYMTCIQTDAPISPGNSGGALVNMYGQVIGITSSKIADTTVEGIGFAITVNEAKPIIDDILNYGFVKGRYRIGIKFHSSYIDEIYDVEGLYIAEIDEDSDIYNTELAVGDIITEINGTKVSDYDDVVIALEDCVAGDSVTAKVFRINEDTSVDEFEIEFKLIEDTSGDY